jgi:hypothetical protein
MKLPLAVFAAFATSVAAVKRVPTDAVIKADSDLGSKLLSQARKLAEEGNQQQNNGEFESSWVAGYSLKFQGCHQLQQWNNQADGEEDVKIATKRLVRFRLCPTDTCSATKAAGCNSGYGDYIIDMNTYVNAYYEAKTRQTEQECENYINYNCDCQDDDGKGDNFNPDYCEYDCLTAAGKSQCIDRNPYEEQGGAQQFNVEDYLECAALQAQNNQQRKLENQANNNAIYVGPYCAEQGGAIYLGVFSDDTCTESAGDYGGKDVFYQMTGKKLPYSSESLVGMDCLSCVEQDQNDADNADQDQVAEQCEEIYNAAGKCESNLPSGMVSQPNTKACTYMDGIKIARSDGIITTSGHKANPVFTAFIVIFAMAFVATGFYVWYLRKRLGVKKNALI